MLKNLNIFCGTLAVFSSPAGGDVLLEQPYDFQVKTLSFEGPGQDGQAGDDFRPTEPVLIESATFWMIVSWPDIPHDWSLNIHRSTRDHQTRPWAPEYDWIYRISGAADILDLGEWNDQSNRHLFEVRFENINFRLDPGPLIEGIYWFSPEGHVWDSSQKCYWGSANTGHPAGSMGHSKIEPWSAPGWVPRTNPVRDYAMRIEGTAIADLPLAHSVEIVNFAILTGELVEGDVTDLRETDDQYLRMRSVRWPRDPTIEVIIYAQTTVEDADVVDILIEHGAVPLAFTETSIYNWRTEEWDLLEDDFVGPPELTRATHNLPAADYVSDRGNIQLLIHHNLPSNVFTRTFESHIDRVWIDVQTSD